MRIKQKILWVYIIFLVEACSYSFSGFLPGYLRKVSVETFTNETQMYGLGEKATLAFLNALNRDGRLEVVRPEQANLIIRGEIKSYKRKPVAYDENGKVLRYKVQITAVLNFYDRVKKDFYLKNVSFSGWGIYDADTENEDKGIERAIEELTQNALKALFLKEF